MLVHSPADDEGAVSQRFESVADMPAVRVRPLRRPECDLLVRQGAFGPDERVQLPAGELVEMSPQGARHAGLVEALDALGVASTLRQLRQA